MTNQRNWDILAEKKKLKIAKKKFAQEKNAIRVIGKMPEPEKATWSQKKKWTGEKKLFEQVAINRTRYTSTGRPYVVATHMSVMGEICEKRIFIENLNHMNFHHEKAKGMNKELRLVEENIQIVSFAYHFWLHNKQIYRLFRKN